MARRIIRGITKLSEDEKRRKAFSNKRETDSQHMTTLLELVQDSPYSPEMYRAYLGDCLRVLYPKAWDTIFKAKADSGVELLKAGYLYFFGRPMDTVAFAANPSGIYWSIFNAIEHEVRQGNHLKASDFAERQGYLREHQTPQITPAQLGYRPAPEPANYRHAVNPEAFQAYVSEVRRRIRATHPEYSANPDMELIRRAFDEGLPAAQAEERVRMRLFADPNNDRPVANVRSAPSSPDTLARRLLQPGSPDPALAARGSQAGFFLTIRNRMRQLHPGWSPENDRMEITAAFNNGRSVDSVVTQLHNRIMAAAPGPSGAVAERRRVRSSRGNSSSESIFIRDVLRSLTDSAFDGTAAERLNYLKTLYRQGHTTADAAVLFQRRYGVH